MDAGSTNDNSRPDAIAPGVSIVVEDQETAMLIALDETRIYWLSTLPNGWSAETDPRYARIRGCMKGDCRSTIITYESTTVDRTGALPPQQLYGLAAGGGNVYWAQTKPGERLSILTCPSTGCLAGPRAVATNVELTSMTVDDTHVYWTSNRDTGIFRVPLSGAGKPQAIALNEAGPDRLVVSETHVYWIAKSGQANASIKRVPKDGGEPPVTLVDEQNQAGSLAIDSEFFYWANSYSVGVISRCPLSGCVDPPAVLIADQNEPRSLLTDGKSIFWMNLLDSVQAYPTRGTVLRCPVDGCSSAVETLAVQVFALAGMSMALDPSDLYWVAQGPEDRPGSLFYPQATIYRHPK